MMQPESNSHIRSLLRGSSMIGQSSCNLGWEGFTVERHEVSAGEKPETILNQHFVVVWTGGPCHGERPNLRGEFVAFSKSRGCVTLLPTGLIPSLRLSSSAEATVVAFDPEFIRSVEGELEQRSSASFTGKLALEEPELSTLVAILMKECASGGHEGRIYAESLAHAIAVRFLHLGKGEQPRGSAYRHVASPQSIRRVLDRMHEEFNTDLSLSTLAAETGYSRRHFLRMFEDATGYTPHQYLLQLRIKRAKELLKKTLMPLIDIAAHSGFSSQSHMSQSFRKYYDATPGQIRRELPQEDA
jgi:AraC family transcriptional regulator